MNWNCKCGAEALRNDWSFCPVCGLKKPETKFPIQIENPDLSKLRKYLREGMINLEKDGRPGKDFEHYVFELVLEAFYGDKIWKWWNVRADY